MPVPHSKQILEHTNFNTGSVCGQALYSVQSGNNHPLSWSVT